MLNRRNLVTDQSTDLVDSWAEGFCRVFECQCYLRRRSVCRERFDVNTLEWHVQVPSSRTTVENRFDPMLPLIVEESVATLCFHFLPLFGAKLALQNLDESLINENRTAEAT
jgi:hypothetical protein